MDEPKRWVKGLGLMHVAKRRSGSRKAQEGGAIVAKRGRPAARRMMHEALHAAMAGMVKA